MRRRRKSANTKRRVAVAVSMDDRRVLVAKVAYGGNPEHKRNPGDFGLTPPTAPRADKSLCDIAEVFERNVALNLLREGVRRGLISERRVGELPQNIWSVTADGKPLEAQLENRTQATYHGYPLTEADPFRDEVLAAWSDPERDRLDD